MNTMSMTMGWAGRSGNPAGARAARAYLKALRAAEQAAWERQIPAVEATRWTPDRAGMSWLPVLAVLALAGGCLWAVAPDPTAVWASVGRLALSWLEAMTA